MGSSSNIRKRWNVHRRDLRLGIHPNRYLQRAYNKYGVDAFEYSMLAVLFTPEFKYREEQRLIDMLKPEYNLAPVAGSALGVKLTAEARKKISESNRRRGPWSDESRAKLSAARTALKGKIKHNNVRSEESRRKQSEAMQGRPSSRLGTTMTDETKAKMRQARLGTTWSDARRAAHEEKWANREKAPAKKHLRPRKPREEWLPNGRPISAERKSALSTRMRGVPKSPEQRAKMAEAARRRWADPSEREKLIVAIKKGLAH